MAAALAVVGFLGWTLLDDRAPEHGAERGQGAQSKTPIRRDHAKKNGGGGGAKRARDTAPVAVESRKLSGRVLDTAGRAIPGVLVAAPGGPRTVTGSDGAYVLRVPPKHYLIEALAVGYLPGSVSLDLSADREHEFRLAEAASLSGVVTDADTGAPVAGAAVYAISAERAFLDKPSRANTASTDDAGHYRFFGLAAGTTDLGVRSAGYLPSLVEDVVIPTGGEHERSFRVQRGRRIDVAVKNADEHTVVYVSHPELRREHLPPGGLPLLADALIGRGLVSVPVMRAAPNGPAYVPQGPIDAEARSPKKITEPGRGSVRDHAGPRLELELIDARPIELKIVDGVSGKELKPTITRESSGAAERFPVERTQDGTTRVPADDRRHTLHLELEGYQPETLDLLADQHSYEVRLQPLAEGATGAFFLEFTPPLADGRIAVVGRDADGRQKWVKHVERADEKGRWEVKGVPVGEWSVSVLASGMIPVTLPVHVTRGFRATHRVALTKGGGIELKIVDRDGKLLDKVALLLRNDADVQIDVHVHSVLGGSRAFVSVNYLPVAATITADSGLAPGAYTIIAARQGYTQARTSFVVRGTETTPVTVTLAPR